MIDLFFDRPEDSFEFALECACREFDLVMADAEFMIEMVSRKEALDDMHSELKVFKESGTIEDLEYLYLESRNEAGKQEEGILTKIINGIMNFFTNIIEGIKNLFKKHSDEPENYVNRSANIEVPEGALNVAENNKGYKVAKVAIKGALFALGTAAAVKIANDVKNANNKKETESDGTKALPGPSASETKALPGPVAQATAALIEAKNECEETLKNEKVITVKAERVYSAEEALQKEVTEIRSEMNKLQKKYDQINTFKGGENKNHVLQALKDQMSALQKLYLTKLGALKRLEQKLKVNAQKTEKKQKEEEKKQREENQKKYNSQTPQNNFDNEYVAASGEEIEYGDSVFESTEMDDLMSLINSL